MFSQEELDYLATQALGRLATVDPTGMPQNSPVGFALRAGDRHDRDRRAGAVRQPQVPQRRRDRKVSLVVDDIASRTRRVRGVEIRGDAEALSEGRGLIRIHPRRVASWGITTQMHEAVARSASVG